MGKDECVCARVSSRGTCADGERSQAVSTMPFRADDCTQIYAISCGAFNTRAICFGLMENARCGGRFVAVPTQ